MVVECGLLLVVGIFVSAVVAVASVAVAVDVVLVVLAWHLQLLRDRSVHVTWDFQPFGHEICSIWELPASILHGAYVDGCGGTLTFPSCICTVYAVL